MRKIIIILFIFLLSSCIANRHVTCPNPYYGMAILSPYMYYDLGVPRGEISNSIFNDSLKIENLIEKYQVTLPKQLFYYNFSGNATILLHYDNFKESKRELTSIQIFELGGLERVNYYKYDQSNKYCITLPENLTQVQDAILTLFQNVNIDTTKITEPNGSIMIKFIF